MTVREHFAFPLRLRKWSRQLQPARVEELADLLEVRHLLDRRPHGLSGGETQRVALGRALSFAPALLVMDEPLSALDDETRQQMHQLLRAVQNKTSVTTLHITHNREELNRLASVRLRLTNNGVHEERNPATHDPPASAG